MKTFAAIALALLAPCAAFAQAPAAAPAAAASCVSQYEDLAGKSAASLVAAGYSVASAVPGGLWLHKDKELAYCNANSRAREGEVLCWKLREPLKGQPCS